MLAERGWSLRRLATEADVDPSHLSKVLRGHAYKSAGGDLASRVAAALSLPADFFPETRAAWVAERLRQDPSLRDRLYDSLRSGEAEPPTELGEPRGRGGR